MKALALRVYELGERVQSLHTAVQRAYECGYPVIIMPVFCRDEATHVRVIPTRDELMRQARELFMLSMVGEIYVSPYHRPR